MKLEIYENFVTVANCRSITAASKLLHIAQPALSAQIRSIENFYQISFFNRLPRSLELTDAGKIFYQHCQNILMMEQNTLMELNNCRSKYTETLKLGVTRSAPDPVLNKLLDTFSKNYPDIHYEIHERNSNDLISMMDNGIIEFAAIRASFTPSPTVNVVLSLSEHFYALCSEDSELLPKDKDSINLTDLKDIPLSVPLGLYPYIRDTCHRYGFSPIIHSTNTSRSFVFDWALRDRAVALLSIPDDYFSYPEGLRCYKIHGNPLSSQRLFITPAGKKLSNAAASLIDTLYSLFAPV